MNSVPITLARKVLLACMLAMSWCFLAADSVASETEQAAGSYWLAVSDKTLDELRGGFDFGRGLTFSIGIERATYINGALITTTSFNFNNLDRLGPELVARINKQVSTLNLIQNGPGNAFQPGASPTTSQGAAARNTQSASGAAVVQNTSSTAPAAVVENTSSGSAATTVQNAPSTTTSTFILNTPSNVPATFIQNTLNDQHIRNLTVINATINSLGMMKSLNSLSTLQQALNSAILSR